VVLFLTFVGLIILVLNLLVMLWDFLFTSMTGCLFFSNPKQFYVHDRSSISYDMTYQLEDPYD